VDFLLVVIEMGYGGVYLVLKLCKSDGGGGGVCGVRGDLSSGGDEGGKDFVDGGQGFREVGFVEEAVVLFLERFHDWIGR